MDSNEASPSNNDFKDSTESGGEDSLIGKVIGNRYRIIKKLGHGGMGSVYSAEQINLKRKVAIKFLHATLKENNEFMERFRREALIGSVLSHQNAVTLFDFESEGDVPYLVMQYVEGETLKSIISREGNLPLERVVNIMSQVSSAVEEAHRIGIIHRDLKPDNILISNSGGKEHVSVLDFGIAKPTHNLNNLSSVNLTRSDVVMGTPQYMSPEQALNRQIGPESDVFSLGIILFEMLSGLMPYKGYSPVEILLKHANETHVELPVIRAEYGIPKKVSDVMLKCLEKSPENRYRTVKDFEEALRSAVESQPASNFLQPSKSKFFFPTLTASTLFILIGVFELIKNQHPNYPSSSPDGLASVTKIEVVENEQEPLMDEIGVITASGEMDTKEEGKYESTQAMQQGGQSDNIEQDKVSTLSSFEPTTVPSDESISLSSDAGIATIPPGIEVTATQVTTQPTEGISESVDNTTTTEASLASGVIEAIDASEDATQSLTKPIEKLTKIELDELQSSANALFQSKQFIRAGVKFKKLLQHRPDSVPDRLSLGVCFLRIGAMEKAYEQFNMAITLDPNYAPTYYNIGSYYAHKGDIENALNSLKKAITLFPKIRTWLKDDADFNNIREEPRFKEFLDQR